MPAHRTSGEPARILRAELQRMRAEGWSFTRAWHDAVETALRDLPGRDGVWWSDRGSWRVAFSWCRGAWRSAYYAAGDPAAWASTLNGEHEDSGERSDVALVA